MSELAALDYTDGFTVSEYLFVDGVESWHNGWVTDDQVHVNHLRSLVNSPPRTLRSLGLERVEEELVIFAPVDADVSGLAFNGIILHYHTSAATLSHVGDETRTDYASFLVDAYMKGLF